MTKFVVEIELGNATMSSSDDVATSLESVARHVRDSETEELARLAPLEKPLYDINGNKVGVFKLVKE